MFSFIGQSSGQDTDLQADVLWLYLLHSLFKLSHIPQKMWDNPDVLLSGIFLLGLVVFGKTDNLTQVDKIGQRLGTITSLEG